MPTILFVTHVQPVPATGGENIRVHNLIKGLCHSFNVIVIAPTDGKESKLHTMVAKWIALPKNSDTFVSNVQKFLGIFFLRPTLKKLIRNAINSYGPEVVWFSWGHMGQYAKLAQKMGSKTIMDAHNVESHLTKQRCQYMKIGLEKAVLRLVFMAQKCHELFLFSNFDVVVSVSEQDHQYHSKIVGRERTEIIPNFVDQTDFASTIQKSHDQALIITGNFTTFQNISAIHWFINKVWPALSSEAPEVRLLVAGKGSDTLNLYKDDQRVSFTGTIMSTSNLIGRSSIAVVPIQYGSGTRLKILEAMACKTPIVSTRLGAEGLHLRLGKDIIIANEAKEFVHSILDLLNDKAKRIDLAENAFRTFVEHYDISVVQERIYDLVMKVVKSK